MAECSLGNFKLHIEIPIALSFFAIMLSASVTTNMVIFRTCYVTLGYNKSECEKLGTNNGDNSTALLEKLVEPTANVIMMTSSLIEQIVPAVVCLFVGPWSDKHGRKPVILSVLTGLSFAYMINTILCCFTNASPWLFMISTIPLVLSGGFASFFTVVLCYITDVSQEGERGLRMGLFEASLVLGTLLGTFLSSYVFNALGYVAVYAICSFLLLVALLFSVFFIPESVVVDENETGSLFQLVHLTDIVKTTIKSRENYKRALLLTAMTVLVVYALAFMSDSSVTFLYLRAEFQWTLQKYTFFLSAKSVLWILGTFVGVYVLHQTLHMSEPILLIIGFVDMMSSYVLMGLANKDWQIYLSGGMRCIGGAISPMIRSLISKTIPSEEIGKVFAFTVTLESLMGIIGSPLYTIFYNRTILTMPGAFNFITAGSYAVSLLLTMLIIVLQRYDIYYSSFPSTLLIND